MNTYWVNSVKEDCMGVVPMECLLVQKGDTIVSSGWEYFYTPIEGFNYEPGFFYQIEVKEEHLAVEDAPADASSIKYSLVKVMSQEADPKFELDTLWIPTRMFEKEISDMKESTRKQMTLEFHLNDKSITGSDGCNSFNGKIIAINQRQLKFGQMASTRMMCSDMTLVNTFNKAMQEVDNYKLKNNNLYLYNNKGNELIALKKVN